MSKPATQRLDFSRLLQHNGQFAEGGGFGPSSFRGTCIDAGYRLYRFPLSDPPSPNFQPGFTYILWAKFHVDEIMEGDGWEGDEFEYTKWGLGRQSAHKLYSTNDGVTASGIDDGFEELQLLAVGKHNDTIIPYTTERNCLPGLDKHDFANTNGRWIAGQKDVAKIEAKCNYNVMLHWSAGAVAALSPEFIAEYAKKGKDGHEETIKMLNMLYSPAEGAIPLADGYPLGALLIIGMSGLWDTAKIDFETKDKQAAQQKVLYLSSYDGRYAIDAEGNVLTHQAGRKSGSGSGSGGSGTTSNAKTGGTAAKPAVQTVVSTTGRQVDAGEGEEGEDMAAKLTRLIVDALNKNNGELAIPQVSGLVLPGNFSKGKGGDMPVAFKMLLDAVAGTGLLADYNEEKNPIGAPDEETAQSWLDIGMVESVPFIKEGNTIKLFSE